MRLYLDTSALNRIFDDQSQPRIYLEASAMLVIFSFIEKRVVNLVSSEALIFENSRNPYDERRIFVTAVLKKAGIVQIINERILNRAREIEPIGIKGIDALHLACAEKMKVDCFITCDDKIIKRYSGKLQVKSPVDFSEALFKGDI